MSIQQLIKEKILYRLEGIQAICEKRNISFVGRLEWKEEGEIRYLNFTVPSENSTSNQKLISAICDPAVLEKWMQIVEEAAINKKSEEEQNVSIDDN